MSDLREADTWLENNPICDADELNKRERELVKAAWQAALSANGGEVEPGDRSPDYYEGYKDGWNNGVDAPSAPDNEIKARALEEFADSASPNNEAEDVIVRKAYDAAARLRTAGDEGEG